MANSDQYAWITGTIRDPTSGSVATVVDGALTVSGSFSPPAVTTVSGTVTVIQSTASLLLTTITNTAINGPGAPTIDSFTGAAINCSASTDQQIIAAPGANKQIWIYGLFGIANVAGTVSLQDEDNTALTGVVPVGNTGGWVMNPSGNFAMPWVKVATNKAVELDTVTCEFDGRVIYAIVSV